MKTEMNELADRLQFLMDSEGLSQKGLSDLTGASPQSVHNWIKRNSISKDSARLVSEKTGYSLDWLLNNIGQPKISRSREISSIPPESEWGTVDAWDSSTPLPNDEVEVPFLKDIELAAGDGSFCEEDYNGYKIRFSKATLRRVGANTDGSGVICFPARGDSMEPIIPDGTTVAVDTNNKRLVDGKLYAISQQGAGDEKLKRVKQIYRKPGGKLIIHSFNRENDEEAEESSVEIMGRIFWYSVIL